MSTNLVLPPTAIDAEQSVLGGLMLEPAALVKISDWLREDDFFRGDHRLIYRAITELSLKGTPCDAVTLGEWFEGNGLAEIVGGASYIIELANTTPSSANIVAYAEIVVEKSRLRQAWDIGGELVAGARANGNSSADVIALATSKLASLAAAKARGGLLPTRTVLKSWFAELSKLYEIGERVTGLPTPWTDLNVATHGFQNGELVLIPARPNMGKSVAGFNLAAFTALRGDRTAVFSLEMTGKQVMRRCVSALGRVPHEWLSAPRDEGDSELYWPRITQAVTELNDAPLLIDDSPALSIDQIRARALRAHLQQPLRLVIVDHMHIVRRAGENEVRELGQISSGLKALAKELDCPVVALAQLNRSVTGRAEKRPIMTDLRASGEIEQDADLILFLHREDYYDRETHLAGIVEIEIGKGRDVKTGERIHLTNRFDQMRLDNLDGPLPSAPPHAPRRPTGFRAGAGREHYVGARE